MHTGFNVFCWSQESIPLLLLAAVNRTQPLCVSGPLLKKSVCELRGTLLVLGEAGTQQTETFALPNLLSVCPKAKISVSGFPSEALVMPFSEGIQHNRHYFVYCFKICFFNDEFYKVYCTKNPSKDHQLHNVHTRSV